ncbi:MULTISPECIES: UvrD-helicase domain-containing protein [Paenibacillus]|uniref:UvrD-helicase domain-containing protein n=1 Tax=Paenibacillus TaxID=44249 RepID=UPI00117E436B|nr:UvrD-helicase domain-containing protein [Paenibacillus odorifer]
MLEHLEFQLKLYAVSERGIQKWVAEVSLQRFNISEEQVTKLTTKQMHQFYTQEHPYVVNPILERYFESVPSKQCNLDPRYLKIESVFQTQKTKYWDVFSKLHTTVTQLNEDITAKTEHAATFLVDVKKARKDYFTYSISVKLASQFKETFDYFGSGDTSGISESTSESIDAYKALNKYRSDWNKEYIQRELIEAEELLSNIDGKSLDAQQRIAVVTDEDSNLVLAGAGSGKTLTIAGKVKYLVERKHVKPEEILLISFTKKSALEMKERIEHRLHIPVVAKTFHALGLEIIAKHHQAKPDIFSDLMGVIQAYMKDTIFEEGQQIKHLIEFFGYYLSIPKDYSEFENLGEYHEFHRNLDFETLKGKMSKSDYVDHAAKAHKSQLKTLAGETVKSFEETLIANFLFLNSIDYEYERDYPLDTRTEQYRQYKPDFYLPAYDLYIEHFGVDEKERTPWLSPIEEEKYLEGMKWKRQQHASQGTAIIETYSYFNKQGVLLEKLQEQLLTHEVTFKEADYLSIFDSVYKENQDKYFKEFVKLLSTFINLFKSSGYEADQFEEFVQQNQTKPDIPFFKRRTELFLSLVRPIYSYYENHLKKIRSIDFNDMVNQATNIVRENNPYFPYSYIIVDEYQDISKSRFGLIQAIREQTKAKVMCVGDDWQGIYRFAGSDLQLFTNFGQYFGAHELMKIEQTYRNSQQLVDVAGRFVMRNKNQFRKELKSMHQNPEPIQILGYQKDKAIALCVAIERIVKDYGKRAKILLLGRNGFDINFLDEEPEFLLNADKTQITYSKYRELQISFLTTHKSKGLEEDHVILLNAENSLVGFPNKIADDPVLGWVLTDQEAFEFAEERRLFYVALTRTRNSVYILTSEQRMSVFVKELIEKDKIPYQLVTREDSVAENPKCPKCQTGHLTRRVGNTTFLGCTNYPGCDYTNGHVEILKKPRLCPRCGGFLVYKKGSRGPFYGCTNFKHNCRYSEDYKFTK